MRQTLISSSRSKRNIAGGNQGVCRKKVCPFSIRYASPHGQQLPYWTIWLEWLLVTHVEKKDLAHAPAFPIAYYTYIVSL